MTEFYRPTPVRGISHPDRWGPLLVILLAAIAPAFEQDDAVLFNYVNNVIGARPIFFLVDYVPVLPEVLAFLLRELPLVVQAVLYRVPPILACLLLYRELGRLLRHGHDAQDAALLTLSSMLLVRAVEIYIWGNLGFVIWPAFLAAVAYVIRINHHDQQYSVWGMAGVILAAASIPVGILLAPIALAGIRRGEGVRNGNNAVLAGAIVAGYFFLNSYLLSAVIGKLGPLEIVVLFRQGFASEYRLNNFVVCLSALILGAAIVDIVMNRRQADARIVGALAFLGFASIGGYLLSDRLVRNDGGFGSVHVLPAMFGALVLASRAILRVKDETRRALLIGVVAGLAAASSAREVYFHLRGPMEIALMKYQFLRDAETFRKHCEDGEGMVFEDEDYSPVVLCRPRHFGPGPHPQTEFMPWLGFSAPGAPPDERPFIYVGRPLF